MCTKTHTVQMGLHSVGFKTSSINIIVLILCLKESKLVFAFRLYHMGTVYKHTYTHHQQLPVYRIMHYSTAVSSKSIKLQYMILSDCIACKILKV